MVHCAKAEKERRGVRVVEGARLESVYTPKAYRGFESLSLRHILGAEVFTNHGQSIPNIFGLQF